jgi:hypothetical protein
MAMKENDLDSLEEQLYNASKEQKDPLLWYLRKILFILSLIEPQNTDLFTSLVDPTNWSEQLAVNLPRDKEFIKECSETRIPSSLKKGKILEILKNRYSQLGLDIEIVDSVIQGILFYSYLIALEANIPITYEHPEMRKIIRTKHLIILSSLENNNGDDNLFGSISDHQIDGFDLAFMTRRQLLPKLYEYYIELQVKRQASEDADIIDPKNLEDGFYDCNRCGQKKTTFESRQIRSADEPATNFITCHICRRTWTEN